MKKRFIIIGSSAAGIACASKLRQLDNQAEIYCFSNQTCLPYNKCLLADFLLKSITPERLFYKDKIFFEKNNINLILNKTVEKIDHKNNKIYFDNQTLEYDSLFLGLGSNPIIPDNINTEKVSNIFTFNTYEDILKISIFIESKSKNGKKLSATIIGTGLTGIECSDVLSSMGLEVTLISKHNQVLANMIDLESSKIIEELIKEKKVNLIKEKIIENIEDLKTDLIIFAIGTKPNIKLAENSGIKTNIGICTNEYLNTSIPNIFAGGDVIITKDILTGKNVRSCTWPDANIQGIIAAKNMIGQKEVYPGVLTTVSSNVYGISFVSCGPVTSPPQDCKILIKKDKDFYHKFLIQNDILIGFLMVGKVDNVGQLRNDILNKIEFKNYPAT